MAQHKWHKEIKAWADGQVIQYKELNAYAWWDCEEYPDWSDKDYQYRIKPQPEEPKYLYVYKMRTNNGLEIKLWDNNNFNSESCIAKIKLEVDN